MEAPDILMIQVVVRRRQDGTGPEGHNTRAAGVVIPQWKTQRRFRKEGRYPLVI